MQISTRYVSTVLGLMAAVAAVGSATTAHAQGLGLVTKPFTVKIGALFSPDGTINGDGNTASNTEPTIGLSYEFVKTKTTVPLVYGVYFDYAAANSKTVDGVKIDVSGYGVGVSGRYLFNTPGQLVMPYAGLGLGVYGTTGKASDGQGDSGSDTKTSIGGKLMAGIEMKSGFLAEINYQFFPDDEGVKLNGVGVSVGYRF